MAVQEQRPGGGEQRPGGGEQRPGGGEQRPGGGEQRPGGGEQRPGSGEQAQHAALNQAGQNTAPESPQEKTAHAILQPLEHAVTEVLNMEEEDIRCQGCQEYKEKLADAFMQCEALQESERQQQTQADAYVNEIEEICRRDMAALRLEWDKSQDELNTLKLELENLKQVRHDISQVRQERNAMQVRLKEQGTECERQKQVAQGASEEMERLRVAMSELDIVACTAAEEAAAMKAGLEKQVQEAKAELAAMKTMMRARLKEELATVEEESERQRGIAEASGEEVKRLKAKLSEMAALDSASHAAAEEAAATKAGLEQQVEDMMTELAAMEALLRAELATVMKECERQRQIAEAASDEVDQLKAKLSELAGWHSVACAAAEEAAAAKAALEQEVQDARVARAAMEKQLRAELSAVNGECERQRITAETSGEEVERLKAKLSDLVRVACAAAATTAGLEQQVQDAKAALPALEAELRAELATVEEESERQRGIAEASGEEVEQLKAKLSELDSASHAAAEEAAATKAGLEQQTEDVRAAQAALEALLRAELAEMKEKCERQRQIAEGAGEEVNRLKAKMSDGSAKQATMEEQLRAELGAVKAECERQRGIAVAAGEEMKRLKAKLSELKSVSYSTAATTAGLEQQVQDARAEQAAMEVLLKQELAEMKEECESQRGIAEAAGEEVMRLKTKSSELARDAHMATQEAAATQNGLEQRIAMEAQLRAEIAALNEECQREAGMRSMLAAQLDDLKTELHALKIEARAAAELAAVDASATQAELEHHLQSAKLKTADDLNGMYNQLAEKEQELELLESERSTLEIELRQEIAILKEECDAQVSIAEAALVEVETLTECLGEVEHAAFVETSTIKNELKQQVESSKVQAQKLYEMQAEVQRRDKALRSVSRVGSLSGMMAREVLGEMKQELQVRCYMLSPELPPSPMEKRLRRELATLEQESAEAAETEIETLKETMAEMEKVAVDAVAAAGVMKAWLEQQMESVRVEAEAKAQEMEQMTRNGAEQAAMETQLRAELAALKAESKRQRVIAEDAGQEVDELKLKVIELAGLHSLACAAAAEAAAAKVEVDQQVQEARAELNAMVSLLRGEMAAVEEECERQQGIAEAAGLQMKRCKEKAMTVGKAASVSMATVQAELEATVQKMTGKDSAMQVMMKELAAMEALLRAELATVMKECERQRQIAEAAGDELEGLKAKLSELAGWHSVACAAAEEAAAAKAALEQEVQDAGVARAAMEKQLRAELSAVNGECERQRITAETSGEEVERLKAKLSELQSVACAAAATTAGLEQQVQDAKAALPALEAELRAELATVEEESERQRGIAEASGEEVEQLKAKLSELDSASHAAAEEAAATKAGLEQQTEDVRAAQAALEALLRAELAEMKEKCERQRQIAEGAGEEVNRLKAKMSDGSAKQATMEEQLRAELGAVKAECERQRGIAVAAGEEMKRLKAKLSELKSVSYSTAATTAGLEQQVQDARAEQAAMEVLLKQELAEMKEECESQRGIAEAAGEEVMRLKTKTSELARDAHMATQEAAATQNGLEQRIAMEAQLRAGLPTVMKECERQRQIAEAAGDELEGLKVKLSELAGWHSVACAAAEEAAAAKAALEQEVQDARVARAAMEKQLRAELSAVNGECERQRITAETSGEEVERLKAKLSDLVRVACAAAATTAGLEQQVQDAKAALPALEAELRAELATVDEESERQRGIAEASGEEVEQLKAKLSELENVSVATEATTAELEQRLKAKLVDLESVSCSTASMTAGLEQQVQYARAEYAAMEALLRAELTAVIVDCEKQRGIAQSAGEQVEQLKSKLKAAIKEIDAMKSVVSAQLTGEVATVEAMAQAAGVQMEGLQAEMMDMEREAHTAAEEAASAKAGLEKQVLEGRIERAAMEAQLRQEVSEVVAEMVEMETQLRHGIALTLALPWPCPNSGPGVGSGSGSGSGPGTGSSYYCLAPTPSFSCPPTFIHIYCLGHHALRDHLFMNHKSPWRVS